MRETTYTPGPWSIKVARDGREYIVIPDKPDEPLARVYKDRVNHASWLAPEVKNAELIAAAPLLYEALDKLITEYSAGFVDGDTWCEALYALDKARGAF